MTPAEWTEQMLEAQAKLAELQRLGAPAAERRDAGLAVGRLKRLRPAGAPEDPAAAEEARWREAVECVDRAVLLTECGTWHELAEMIAGLPNWTPEPLEDGDNVVPFPGAEGPEAGGG